MNPELSPLQQAEAKIPYALYEDFQLFLAATALAMVTLHALLSLLPQDFQFEAKVVAGLAFTAGVITDKISTIKALKAANRAREYGLPVKHSEAHILVPGITDPKKYLVNPKVLASDILLLGTSIMFPGIGFAYAGSRGFATLSNIRVAKRYNLATSIAMQSSD